MVKPQWGYAMSQYQDRIEFPEGYTEGAQKDKLLTKRAFFEIKLHSWVVRHDLDGDGQILKTIFKRGVGYDRADRLDEIVIDIKIF